MATALIKAGVSATRAWVRALFVGSACVIDGPRRLAADLMVLVRHLVATHVYVYIYIYIYIFTRCIILRFVETVCLNQDSAKGGAVETGCSGLHYLIGCFTI